MDALTCAQAVMMITCFLSMPVYFAAMNRIGKRNTFSIGLWVCCRSLLN